MEKVVTQPTSDMLLPTLGHQIFPIVQSRLLNANGQMSS